MNREGEIDPHALQFSRMRFKIMAVDKGYMFSTELFSRLNMRYADMVSSRTLHQNQVYFSSKFKWKRCSNEILKSAAECARRFNFIADDLQMLKLPIVDGLVVFVLTLLDGREDSEKKSRRDLVVAC